jgi:hypothetical protein
MKPEKTRARLGLERAVATITLAITPAMSWAAAVPIASLKVLDEPSLALRVATARQAGLGRDQHFEAAMECDPWFEGRLVPCRPVTSDLSEIQLAAAVRLAEAYRVEPPARTKKVSLTVRVAWPTSYEDAPQSAPVDAKLVNWVRRPRPDQLGQFFPASQQRNATGIALSALCRIMEDLSVSCLPPTGDDEGGEFAPVMERFMLTLRSAPTLTDGRPAAGRWVRQVMRFEAAPK